jgi:hypothetical protein
MFETLLVDPRYITKYDRTPRELELFFLFTIFVANKPAIVTAEKLTAMFRDVSRMPRDYLKRLGPERRMDLWRKHRLGQYGRIERAVSESFGLRLDVCLTSHLLSIHGIGPKTARFFILHSRRYADCAILDTHILKYLRDRGFGEVPKSTPQSDRKYRELELLWLRDIQFTYPDLTPAEADLAIWRKYSGN